jgi:hypothetical protein
MQQNEHITSSEYIFKYLPLNIYTLQTLINNELFFSAPKDFNDPSDCKFKLSVNADLSGATSFYDSLNLTKEEKEVKIKNFLQSKDEFHRDIETEYNTKFREQYGVTCFSEKKDIPLMWSNYADKHRGICLIFDWKIHKEFFMGYKVIYESSIQEISYDGNGLLEISKAFLTKLNHWSYEHEVRAILKLNNGNNQIAAFNPKALKGIIFGERILPIDKKTILNIIKTHLDYKDIDYYRQSTDDIGQIQVTKI